MSEALDRAVMLCDHLTDSELRQQKVTAWHWGPALFGHALTRLDDHLGEPRYDRWLRHWCDHHLAAGPAVNQSDTAAPALITYPMQQRPGGEKYRPLTEAVINYIRTEPRIVGDACNHLGPSLIGRFYPRSVWVDSLMMFGVFPAWYGTAEGATDLRDIAASQPEAYSDLMQHPSGLWSHSWWARTSSPYPADMFWGRGNGWVIAALPMIMEHLGDHERVPGIAEVLRRTSEALLRLQSDDGTWTTLLDRGGYRELSATALIAAGWFDAVRLGHLPDSYLAPATRALAAVTDAVTPTAMPEISGPTIPLPLLPELGYRWIPRGANHPYGVAAFVFAAIAAEMAFR